MNIESKLWKVVWYGYQIAVLQKASGTQRFVSIGKFPNSEALAAMSERQFNRLCREAFHGERKYQ
jgi:hypothetical protein